MRRRSCLSNRLCERNEAINIINMAGREQKVMLDRDLADLYQVETRTLNQAVRKNFEHFL